MRICCAAIKPERDREMPLFAIGLNYLTAPIQVRERVAFPLQGQCAAVAELRRTTAADEAMLVSTCNRTELYLRAATADVIEKASAWLAALPAVCGSDLRPHLYPLTGAAVPRHAFRVASGLESMVLGEPQILGQVKLAVKIAGDANALAGPLNRLFQETLNVAKEVRTNTAVGAATVSMAAAAGRIAQQIFGDIRTLRVLLIGAGEMIDLVAAHFSSLEPKEIVVANRTLARGRELAGRFDARAITLEQLPDCIEQFDVVITSTASSLPIIGKGMIERALRQRRRKPVLIVDLAVPRDVEPEVGDVDGVYLHTLDSLGRLIGQNMSLRKAAVADADIIIDRRTNDFMQWLEARSAVPAIMTLRERAAAIRSGELRRAQKMLAGGADPAEVIASLARGLTNKFLHPPLNALHNSSGPDRDQLASAMEVLCGGSAVSRA